MLLRFKIGSNVYAFHLLVVPTRAMKIDYCKCRHFNTVCVKLHIAPLIKEMIADIRKDKARVRSLWPASSVIDRPRETHAQSLVWFDVLENFLFNLPGGRFSLHSCVKICQDEAKATKNCTNIVVPSREINHFGIMLSISSDWNIESIAKDQGKVHSGVQASMGKYLGMFIRKLYRLRQLCDYEERMFQKPTNWVGFKCNVRIRKFRRYRTADRAEKLQGQQMRARFLTMEIRS